MAVKVLPNPLQFVSSSSAPPSNAGSLAPSDVTVSIPQAVYARSYGELRFSWGGWTNKQDSSLDLLESDLLKSGVLFARELVQS